MQKTFDVKRMVLASMMVALCVVLPIAFHAVPNGGATFLPMHIPILLCGMLCGWHYGVICGLLGPLLSCLLTGMPAMAILPAMMVECAVYGLVTGLTLRFVRTGKWYIDLYIALILAMLLGRVMSGVAKAWIFSMGLTMKGWVTASFVTALPGIVIQLALVPLLVAMLMKLRFLPTRYNK